MSRPDEAPGPPLSTVRRTATDADGPALAELIESCFSEYPGCVLDVDGEEPWLRAPATAYRAKGGVLWVYCDRDETGPVIACGGFRPDGPDRFELKNLYVGAAARRRGIGAEVVDLVEAEARSRDLPVVHLWTDTRFTDAHRLYERLSYQRLPETRELHDKSATVEFHYEKTL